MRNLLDQQIGKLHQAGALLLSLGAVCSLPEILVALAIAIGFIALRQWNRRGRIRPRAILRALIASRRIILNRSTYADLFYYGVNTFAIGTLIGWGVFSAFAVSHLVVRGCDAWFGVLAPLAVPEWALQTGVTIVAFLGYEFGYYVDHYFKHKIPFLWAFHKTHHSAEVLTPLTVFRVHPVDSLIFVDVVALCAGLFHGLFTYAVGKNVGIYVIDDCNVISLVCFFLLAQLQHSQFWIPLRGLPGRIILSPAHHQMHHSIDPAHYNCNLGSSLAIWDWMFGTLNVPAAELPRLKFGVVQAAENPHRVSALLIDPIVNAARVLVPKAKPAPETAQAQS